MTSVLTTASQKILRHANDWVTEYHRDPMGGLSETFKTSRYGHLSWEIVRRLRSDLSSGDVTALSRWQTMTEYPPMAKAYMEKHCKVSSHADAELINVFAAMLVSGEVVGLNTLKEGLRHNYASVLLTPHLKHTNMDFAVLASSTRTGWGWWIKEKPLSFPYEQPRPWPHAISKLTEELTRDDAKSTVLFSRLSRLKELYGENLGSEEERWREALECRVPMPATRVKRFFELVEVGTSAKPLLSELIRKGLRTARLLRSDPPPLMFGSSHYESLATHAAQGVDWMQATSWPELGKGEKPVIQWLQDVNDAFSQDFFIYLKVLASDAGTAKDLRKDRARITISRILDLVSYAALTQKHRACQAKQKTTPAL
jgi:hypothetical protein